MCRLSNYSLSPFENSGTKAIPQPQLCIWTDIPRISHLPCGNIASEYMLHYRRCCLTSTKQSCMSPMVLVNRYWSFLQRLYSFSVAPAALWSCISQYIGFIGRTQGKRQYNNNQYCMYNFISFHTYLDLMMYCQKHVQV